MGAPDGAEDADNVDQFYDDGGETFLPADHVSDCNWFEWFQIKVSAHSLNAYFKLYNCIWLGFWWL